VVLASVWLRAWAWRALEERRRRSRVGDDCEADAAFNFPRPRLQTKAKEKFLREEGEADERPLRRADVVEGGYK